MKKFASILLAVLFICTMTINVFAAEAGSITINGIVEGADYEIYKLLDLHTYDQGADNYYYTVNSAWAGFFATAEALEYVEIVDGNHVEWIAAETDAVVAEFAQKALTYAKANSIAPVKSSKNEDEFAVTGSVGVFSDLELGYYLVDSTVGVLCKLTTTDPAAEIDEKNTVPTVDKEVQNNNGNWDEDNTASIGDIVNFKVTITVGAGPEKYVLHDKMSAGLTFVQDLENGRGVTEITLAGVTLTLGVDYNVVTAGLADDCTLEVVFTEVGMDKMTAGAQLEVFYNAQLNEKAVVEGAGTDNKAHLQYGDEMTSESTTDETETKTFSIDLIKTNGEDKLIDGAEFRIYDAAIGGNEIPVVKMANGNYRLAMEGEVGEAIVVKDGKVTIAGFGNGTYYLEETKVPAGYNMLTARKPFTITNANLDSIINEGVYTPGSGVQVINKTGSQLPETGGAGTVIFVSLGVLVVLAAGVLLVTKKRMAMIQE